LGGGYVATIDHPLLEATRVLESGWLDPEIVRRSVEEWRSGPLTAARLRESVFELLGWRGQVPVAIEEVFDPEFSSEYLGVACWAAFGPIDDSSVLQLADDSWFAQVERPDDREMVVIKLADQATADELRAMLDGGRKPVWAVPATQLMPLGSERSYRAFMASDEPLE
jgi:hypothetical protein